jgi:ABC-type glycerol-3-phosphate transport system substrate-binding protein
MNRLSRRNFLKATALLGAGASLGQFGSALAHPSSPSSHSRAQSGVNLSWWWWGEQELPGLQTVVDNAVAAWKKAGGGNISTLLQDTSVVISQFQTAAAAGEAPDLQYLWNGIYHMESVWFGYVAPLNGLVSDKTLADSGATALSFYEGKQYRVGWYPIQMLWFYNKELFDRAGLDADAPPKTWDEFLAACDTLKSAGITPFGGGIQDGFWGEWFFGHALSQSLDSPAQAIQLFIGDLDFRDPQYHECWTRLQELRDLGFLNNDISSLELYPGIDKLVNGELAMTVSVGTRIPADNAAMNGNLGLMVMPVFGKGALAGRPIVDAQGLGISADSRNKEEAAAFLEFLNTPEQLNAFWEATGWMPTNVNWDSSVIEDPVVAKAWNEWNLGDNIAYVANLIPAQFWTDAMFVAAQSIVNGEMDGEEAGEQNARVVQEWRDFNPDLLEKYQTWAASLA